MSNSEKVIAEDLRNRFDDQMLADLHRDVLAEDVPWRDCAKCLAGRVIMAGALAVDTRALNKAYLYLGDDDSSRYKRLRPLVAAELARRASLRAAVAGEIAEWGRGLSTVDATVANGCGVILR